MPEAIDWQAVYSEVLTTERNRPVADYDYEDAKELVHILADRFLTRDQNSHSFTFVEHRFETPYCRGVADLGNTSVIVDWKTRVTGELDPAWQARHVDSWQWRITAAAMGCRTFIYRGIARQTGKVREVEIEVPEDNNERVVNFLSQLHRAREAYISFSVWPQNKPSACYAFNRTCEFYTQCSNGTEPVASILSPPPFSYSGAMTFLACPEKHRRTLLAPDTDRGTEESEFGQMVHRGIAEVYKQTYGIEKEIRG